MERKPLSLSVGCVPGPRLQAGLGEWGHAQPSRGRAWAPRAIRGCFPWAPLMQTSGDKPFPTPAPSERRPTSPCGQPLLGAVSAGECGSAHPSQGKSTSVTSSVLKRVPALGSQPAVQRPRQSPHTWAPPSCPGMAVVKTKCLTGDQSRCFFFHLPPGAACPSLILPLLPVLRDPRSLSRPGCLPRTFCRPFSGQLLLRPHRGHCCLWELPCPAHIAVRITPPSSPAHPAPPGEPGNGGRPSSRSHCLLSPGTSPLRMNK